MKTNTNPHLEKTKLLRSFVLSAALLAAVSSHAQNNLIWSGSSATWDFTAPNWLLGMDSTNFNDGDFVTFDETAANFNPSLTVPLSPGSVTVNGASNYTFSGAGKLSGSMGIMKNGDGTLTVNNANDFTGQVLINGGTLRAGNNAALGDATGNTVIADGATLDINGRNLTAEPVTVQGAGASGIGAINNSGGQNQNALRFVTLAGDTLFNAAGGRWDIGNAGTPGGLFAGNGFTLTKMGAQQLFLKDVGDTGLGDIVVLSGQLGFQHNIGMGDPSKSATVHGPSGEIRFFAVASDQNKHLVLTNGGTLSTTGGSNNFVGPVTLQGPGTNTINVQNANTAINLFGPISGEGGFQKIGASPLYLSGTNSYTGPTFLSVGSIVLAPEAVFGPSSLIQLAAGTTLDATAPGLSLGDQTLAGFGTVLGDVTANGSTFSPGSDTVANTLTVFGNLALSDATLAMKLSGDPFSVGTGVNDFLSISGDLTLDGTTTIEVAPVGPLSSGAPYTIAQYGGVLTGGAVNLQVTSPNPRYNLNVLDPATTLPFIQVSVTGNPGALVWRGGKTPNPTAWDHSTTNWFNSGIGGFDFFFDGDVAIFDDTAATNLVTIVGTNNAGLVAMSNNAVAYTFTGDGVLGGALTMDGTNSLTLAMSNAPALTSITNNSGKLIFALGASNNTVAADISDNFSGNGGIIKNGNDTLTLSGNNTFFGDIQVNSGTLRAGRASALGTGGGKTVIADGATLDVNGFNLGTEAVEVQGAGVNGIGAINNSGGGQQQALRFVTLLDDTTFNASSNRWDIGNNNTPGAVFNGNGFNLTKIGAQPILIKDAGDTALGDIHVVAGRLGFQGAVGLGDPTKTLTLNSGTILTVFQFGGPEALDKILVMNDGAGFDSGGGLNIWLGPVTLNGTNTFGTRADLVLSNSVTGNGTLIATVTGPVGNGNGALYLEGTNTYTGSTIIRPNSRIFVGANSSLGSSSLVQLDNGSTLDVSALADFNFSVGQVLIGSGTVNANNLMFANGSALAPGFPLSLGALNVFGNLNLQAGSTSVFKLNPETFESDSVVGATTVTFGGTLVLSNVTATAFVPGQTFTLFNASGYSESFSEIIPATPGPGLAWDASNLAVNGTIGVVATSTSEFTGLSVLPDGNFQLSFTGPIGAQYTLLASTNVALPLAEWTTIDTGTINESPFSVSDLTATNFPARFYILSTE